LGFHLPLPGCRFVFIVIFFSRGILFQLRCPGLTFFRSLLLIKGVRIIPGFIEVLFSRAN